MEPCLGEGRFQLGLRFFRCQIRYAMPGQHPLCACAQSAVAPRGSNDRDEEKWGQTLP